jgi:hypothetical protein
MIPIHNFDFLLGKWSVLNKRLNERLNNCNDWTEFTAFMETKTILNGLAFMDEMKTSYFGEEFIGLSIRMVDPKTNNWTIYWADTANPASKIKEQVSGTFKDGIGTFYGKETFENKEMQLRFLWKKETLETAKWEQAYFDETTKQWETNWTMLFTKSE